MKRMKGGGAAVKNSAAPAVTVAVFSLDTTGPVLSKTRGGSLGPVRLGLLPELSSAHKREGLGF